MCCTAYPDAHPDSALLQSRVRFQDTKLDRIARFRGRQRIAENSGVCQLRKGHIWHPMPWENRVVPLDCIGRCSTVTGGRIREQKLQLHSTRQPSLVGLLSWSGPGAHGQSLHKISCSHRRDR
eukprot:s1287_g2.t1